jgi:chromosome segregation ATPase
MSSELYLTFALIFAFACLGFAVFSRNRLAQSQAVLADVSSRLEALSKQNKQLEQGLRNAQENADKYRQQSVQSDKHVDDLKQKLNDRTVEWNKLKSEREDVQKRYALQREHLDEQVQVLTQQLADAIREKKLVQDENARLQKEGDEKSRQAMEILRSQVREAQQQTQQVRREKQQLENQLARAKEEAPRIKPEELQRYKQKVMRLEQLYSSMRGLRELAEERNKNWETALRYFAGHILQKPLDAELQAQSIGRLVGEALEKIGASLVIETRAEAAAAEAAAVAAAADTSPIAATSTSRAAEAVNPS